MIHGSDIQCSKEGKKPKQEPNCKGEDFLLKIIVLFHSKAEKWAATFLPP